MSKFQRCILGFCCLQVVIVQSNGSFCKIASVYHESCKVVIFISFCSFSRWEQSEIACLGSSVYPPSLLYTPIHTHTHSSTHIFGFEIHRWNKLCLQMVITKIKGFVCLILNYNVLCIKCTFVTISIIKLIHIETFLSLKDVVFIWHIL